MGLHTHHLLSKGELSYNNRTQNGAMHVSHTPGFEALEKNRGVELLDVHTLAVGFPCWRGSGVTTEQKNRCVTACGGASRLLMGSSGGRWPMALFMALACGEERRGP